jgi:hypothetical protein
MVHLLTLGSEAGLLLFAAQTGYIGGPRVMANMALDGWVPRRFSSLSDRLTSHYGVLMVGAAAIGACSIPAGSVDVLVTMYAINVFVTFSLSQLGMSRFSWMRRHRKGQGLVPHPAPRLFVPALRRHPGRGGDPEIHPGGVGDALRHRLAHRPLPDHPPPLRAGAGEADELNAQLGDMQTLARGQTKAGKPASEMDPKKQTAVFLVNAYSGLGIHTLLITLKTFPGQYSQVYFVRRRARLGQFQGDGGSGQTRAPNGRRPSTSLCSWPRRSGWPPTATFALGTDPVEESTELCLKVREKFPRSVFFAGKAPLRDGEVVLPAAPQRDRLRHFAPVATPGHPDGGHADPHLEV